MSNNMEDLKNECRTIEDNARHAAKAHHIIASWSKRKAFWLEITPAISAALFVSLLVVGEQVPEWVGWIAVVSAIFSATNSVMSPQKSYYENLNAAKSFIVVKNKAHMLASSLAGCYTEKELCEAVKAHAETYNQLILVTPPTEEWAYKKAVDKLSKSGTIQA